MYSSSVGRQIPVFWRNILPYSSALKYVEQRIGSVMWQGCKECGDLREAEEMEASMCQQELLTRK
jgi:hypothetical protein